MNIRSVRQIIVKNLPIIILVMLLIGNGIYTYSMQDRLRQTEYKLTALQDKIAQLAKEKDSLGSEVDKLEEKLEHDGSGTSPYIYTPGYAPTAPGGAPKRKLPTLGIND